MPGTWSYEQPLDFLVWSHCYLELAYKAPPFYPEEFEVAATAILEELNMNREDITISNVRPIAKLHDYVTFIWTRSLMVSRMVPLH